MPMLSDGLPSSSPERRVIARPELDARDVLDAHARAIGTGADDDALERADVIQPPLRADGVLELLVRIARRGADLTGGDLHVLLAHRPHHVAGGDAETGHASGVEPHPHAVVAGAEDRRLADAGDT